jgi:hypothetical protein
MDTDPRLVVYSGHFVAAKRELPCTANNLLSLLMDNVVQNFRHLPSQ